MPIPKAIDRYFDFLDRQGKVFNTVAGLVCVALLGGVDWYLKVATGTDYTLVLFYLLPVAFVAWFSGRRAGIAVSFLAAVTKMSVKLVSNEAIALTIWKNGTALAFFLIISLLLSKIRLLLDQERTLSRTDHLTGAVNSRAFLEATTQEIQRLSRNGPPFTMVYIDLDNFKQINDIHDHTTGDEVLQSVVATMTGSLRKTDVVARLGGDEFALLLPDTAEAAAGVVIAKIRGKLASAEKKQGLSVSASIGVVTCTVAPRSANEIISLADSLMYEVKRSGKNGFRQVTYPATVVGQGEELSLFPVSRGLPPGNRESTIQ